MPGVLAHAQVLVNTAKKNPKGNNAKLLDELLAHEAYVWVPRNTKSDWSEVIGGWIAKSAREDEMGTVITKEWFAGANLYGHYLDLLRAESRRLLSAASR